jgi:hypothetical protein
MGGGFDEVLRYATELLDVVHGEMREVYGCEHLELLMAAPMLRKA